MSFAPPTLKGWATEGPALTGYFPGPFSISPPPPASGIFCSFSSPSAPSFERLASAGATTTTRIFDVSTYFCIT